MDDEGRLVGSASTVRLVQADPTATFESIVETEPVSRPSRLGPSGPWCGPCPTSNLIVAPVMDPEHGEILGVVTVDDVLELLLPTGWRRDFGRTAVEE